MSRASLRFKFLAHLMFGSIFTLSACGETTYNLAIDLRTDLVAGVEFDSVRLVVDGEAQTFAFDPDASYLDGTRLEDLRLEGGDHQIVGALTLAGRTVLERAATVRMDTDRAMTVLLSRSCRGVDCSSSGAAREACSAGMCVDERCTPETPEFCPLSPECNNATDCAAGMCGYRTCAAGVCLRGDDGTCGGTQYCDPSVGCLDRPSPAATDAGVDASVPDAGTDAPFDAGTDAPFDAGTDAPFDAGTDAPMDAGTDAPVDAGTDAPDADRVCSAMDGIFGCLPVTQSLRVGTGSPPRTALIGSGDWVTNAFTIELWVRQVTDSGGAQLFFARRTAGIQGVLFGLLSGQLFVQLSDTPNYQSGTESLVLGGDWVHVAVTRQADQLRFYENGVEVGSLDTVVTRDITGDIAGFLGRDSNAPNSAFDGTMHHLRVWNRALTQEEIAEVAYSPVAPSDPSLLAEYTMQGSGQVLRDSTGRHDGTLGSTAMVEENDALREAL
ncbi:MAG: LamG-like jellyroll fold domain-containing protein [Polyangiales bacterium]